MVGEQGRELIIPSHGGKVMSHQQTENAIGGGGRSVVYNQTNNFTPAVESTVRREIIRMMPQIEAATRQSIIESRRRGGATAAAFGG